MTAVKTLTAQQRRLVDLAAWAAGEDVKRQLGLPSEWDQGSWIDRACGTACCIAGKVALDDGGIPVIYDRHYDPVGFEESKAIWATPGELPDGYDYSDLSLYFPSRGGHRLAVDEYAREALGLTYDQGHRLFHGDNKLDDIVRIVGELIAESA